MPQDKALDRRVARTRRSLAEALISLALELGYDRISVRDLTERADVGYATFFRHFRSKDELATYCVRGATGELMRVVQSAETLYEESIALFKAIDKHRDVCLFALSLPRDHPALKPMWEETAQLMMELYSARDGETIPLDVSVNHVVNSCVALFRWWLIDGQDCSIEQMALIYSELIIKVTEAVALDHRKKTPREAVPD